MIYAIGTGEKFFASISLQYPPNSTCTCTKGNYSYVAQNVGLSKDTNGNEWNYCTFLVPEAGEWTITISDGVSNKTLKANVTKQYESVLIEKINLRRYIWNSGAYDAATGGFSRTSGKNVGVTIGAYQNSPGIWAAQDIITKSKSPINISRYSKLVFNLVQNSVAYAGSNGTREFGILGVKAIVYKDNDYEDSLGEKEIKLDGLSISSLKTATIYLYGDSGYQSYASGVTNYNDVSLFANKIWVE